MRIVHYLSKGVAIPHTRPAMFFVLLVLSSFTLAAGCTSTPRSLGYRPPSILEQTVAAMDREDWETADDLIDTILPELPDRDSDADPDEVVINDR